MTGLRRPPGASAQTSKACRQGYRRAVLVGPLPPFRGGIAQHTTMLFHALRTQTDLRAISFARQYPAWLFPGESDTEPGQFRIADPNCEYIVDPLNPVTWRKALKRIREHQADLVIIPWWTVFWAPCFWYLARGCHAHGLEVRFFCHNLVDHESAGWKTFLTRRVLNQGQSYVVQASSEADRLRDLIPGARVLVHPHPLYDQFPEPTRQLRRRANKELLFYGFVRPYKGLDVLIEALARVRDKDIYLTVVGEFWSGLAEIRSLITKHSLDAVVEIIPRYVTEEETAAYFARADALVLPYRSATGSGVLAIAYRYEKPVIATTTGAFPDVVRDGETGYLVPPGSPGDLAAAIDRLTRERAGAMAPAIRAMADGMSWDSLARCVLDVPHGDVVVGQQGPVSG